MDEQKRISFPSIDGRILDLLFTRSTGQIEIKETLEGESETISTNLIELKTIQTFISLLEAEEMIFAI
jgi:hypothetical protein